MRISLLLLTAAALAAGTLFFIMQGDSEETMRPSSKVEEPAMPMRMASAASTTPSLDEEEQVIPPAAQAAEGPRRVVRLSSDERRPGETELTYKTRSSWLENFRSFEKRAQMSEEQHELFMQVLADAQQEAVLGWQEMEAAGKEIRGTKDADWSTVPSIRAVSESMNTDLLARLRTFLTHKQMVSFRRTSMLPRALGYGLFKPLEFTVNSEATGAQ